MSPDEADSRGGDIDGLSVDAAVERVQSRDDSRDPEAVRAALKAVAQDGVVTWGGVEEALAHASKVVATPETRIELAERELEEAREAAESVTDLDTVAARVEEFEGRLAAIQRQVDGLGSRLDSLVERVAAGDDLFVVAAEIQRLESTATEMQGAADDLKLEVESFQEWVADASVRVDELQTDVGELADLFAELETTVDELASIVEEGIGTPDSEMDVGALWFGALLQQRTLQFMVSDIRRELADIRTWIERENEGGGERLAAVDAELDALSERGSAVADQLDDLTQGAWLERFGQNIATFDRGLQGLSHPVDWGEVERLLEEQRATVE